MVRGTSLWKRRAAAGESPPADSNPHLRGSERGTQVAPPGALGPRGRGHSAAQCCLCRWLHRRREGRCHGAGLQHTDCERRRLAAPQHALDRGGSQRLAGRVSCADVGDRRDDLSRSAETVPWNGDIDRTAGPWANTERGGAQRNAGALMAGWLRLELQLRRMPMKKSTFLARRCSQGYGLVAGEG